MVAGETGGYRLVVRLRGKSVVHEMPQTASPKQAVAQVALAVRRHAAAGAVEAVELQRFAGANGTEHWAAIERWDAEVIARILEQRPPTPTRLGLPAVPATEPEFRLTAAPPPRKNGKNGHSSAKPAATPAPPPKPDQESRAKDAVRRGTAARSAAPATSDAAKEPPSVPPPPTSRGVAPAPAIGAPPASRATTRPRDAYESLPPLRARDETRAAGAPASRRSHRWHAGTAVTVIGVAWVAMAAVLAGGQITSVLRSSPATQPAAAEHLPFDGNSAGRPVLNAVPATTGMAVTPAASQPKPTIPASAGQRSNAGPSPIDAGSAALPAVPAAAVTSAPAAVAPARAVPRRAANPLHRLWTEALLKAGQRAAHR
jgi:hypothetical protein